MLTREKKLKAIRGNGIVSAKKLARKVSSDRRCSKIFCATSHTVGDNKLCAIYLIYRLDHLNYIMGSQRPWMVFELLDLLSAVII